MLMFVLVSMLSCTNVVVCDEYAHAVHSAIVNITYRDPATGLTVTESDLNGKYGFYSRTEAESGVVVHVRTSDAVGQSCVPQISTPAEKWIALVDRAQCRVLNQKIQNSPVMRNASAVVIYVEDDDSEHEVPLKRQQKGEEGQVIYVFIGRQRGEQIAALVDNGTRVSMNLSVGRMNALHYSTINKTSMLFLSISFIVLMIISLAWLVFYYVQRSRYTYAKQRLSRRLMSAAKKAITKMPLRTVHSGEEMETGFDLCAICIEGYHTSDVVRILPCKHVFHKSCIDPWLIEHRSCPICKIDILKAFGMQVYRSQDSTMNIEAEVASTSFGYSEYVPPDSARDFDSDGVEIVRFQLAQIEYHSMHRQPSVCDADSEADTGASDEISSFDHLLENPALDAEKSETHRPSSSSAEPQWSLAGDAKDVGSSGAGAGADYACLASTSVSSSARRGKSAVGESEEGTEMMSLMNGRQDSNPGQQYS